MFAEDKSVEDNKVVGNNKKDVELFVVDDDRIVEDNKVVVFQDRLGEIEDKIHHRNQIQKDIEEEGVLDNHIHFDNYSTLWD